MEKINLKQERNLSIDYNETTKTFRIELSDTDTTGITHTMDYYLRIEDAIYVMNSIQERIKDYLDNPF